MKGVYLQIVLDPESRYITTFCTHMGIYRYKRLNFGVNTSGEILQKKVEEAFEGLVAMLT